MSLVGVSVWKGVTGSFGVTDFRGLEHAILVYIKRELPDSLFSVYCPTELND